jgi:phage terminase small subunit
MAKMTERKEIFARAFVETGDSSAAYRAAYSTENMKPETIHNKGYQVRNMDEVKARIKELQEEVKQRHNVTVDSLMAELEEARQAALSAETPQSSAAVSATMGKAKLAGLDKQIIEHKGTMGVVNYSPSDYQAATKALEGKLGSLD